MDCKKQERLHFQSYRRRWRNEGVLDELLAIYCRSADIPRYVGT
jgi:hypothetical protein